jgi:hypothetical protein
VGGTQRRIGGGDGGVAHAVERRWPAAGAELTGGEEEATSVPNPGRHERRCCRPRELGPGRRRGEWMGVQCAAVWWCPAAGAGGERPPVGMMNG